jgi:archaellum biogenesis protein FlaJ (TadC family)
MFREQPLSFREQSAWISLLAYTGLYGYYFVTLFAAIVAGRAGTFAYSQLLVRVMFLLVVVEVLLQVGISLRSPKEATAPADERERVIALKATRVAFHVVMIGAAAICAAIALGAPAFYTTNGLFLAIVLAEVARNTSQVVYFRWDA